MIEILKKITPPPLFQFKIVPHIYQIFKKN